MYKFASTILFVGVICISSCQKEDRADLSHSQSCELPSSRRPRFLPGPECPDVTSPQERVILPIEGRIQQCSEWCWGAVFSALSSYNGIPRSSCEIVSMGSGNSCCVMNPCAATGCNQGLPLDEVSSLLDRLGISSERVDRPLSDIELRAEILSGRPVLMMQTNGESGARGKWHLIIVYGYVRGLFLPFDPMSASFTDIGGYNYPDLQNIVGAGWRWKESWRIRSKNQGACYTP